MQYAFIGLGNLGLPLAHSLLESGIPLTVHDLHREAAAPLLARGARWEESPRAAASAADALITVLPSPAATRAVLEGRDGALAGLAPGGTWIEMSTNDATEIERLAALASAGGVATLAAPVTGGVHLAHVGRITVLVGGEEAVFERHRPALAAMGDPVLYMGTRADAALVKVITNMLAFVHLWAAGEALMLAARGGLDLGRAYQAIRASSGDSFVLGTEGQLILNGSYDVGFTFDLVAKDLGFALGYGKTFGAPLELAEHVEDIFERARHRYGGDAQSTQVVKLLEEATGTALRAPGFPARLFPEPRSGAARRDEGGGED